MEAQAGVRKRVHRLRTANVECFWRFLIDNSLKVTGVKFFSFFIYVQAIFLAACLFMNYDVNLPEWIQSFIICQLNFVNLITSTSITGLKTRKLYFCYFFSKCFLWCVVPFLPCGRLFVCFYAFPQYSVYFFSIRFRGIHFDIEMFMNVF